jgi:hypothetical protein
MIEETKLILLKRKIKLLVSPYEGYMYEVHLNEVERAKNLLFTTSDKELAEKIVERFNRGEATP